MTRGGTRRGTTAGTAAASAITSGVRVFLFSFRNGTPGGSPRPLHSYAIRQSRRPLAKGEGRWARLAWKGRGRTRDWAAPPSSAPAQPAGASRQQRCGGHGLERHTLWLPSRRGGSLCQPGRRVPAQSWRRRARRGGRGASRPRPPLNQVAAFAESTANTLPPVSSGAASVCGTAATATLLWARSWSGHRCRRVEKAGGGVSPHSASSWWGAARTWTPSGRAGGLPPGA